MIQSNSKHALYKSHEKEIYLLLKLFNTHKRLTFLTRSNQKRASRKALVKLRKSRSKLLIEARQEDTTTYPVMKGYVILVTLKPLKMRLIFYYIAQGIPL